MENAQQKVPQIIIPNAAIDIILCRFCNSNSARMEIVGSQSCATFVI